MTERELFIAALQKENLAERQAYLDAACADGPELREQVQGLLRLYEGAGSFLQKPALAGDATCVFVPPTGRPAHSETLGTMIGPYKLLQQIGEGGMGTVFMAEQAAPIRRKVALKVIKPGMDSGQVVARFETERQALAMMDHVNIARVIDGGTTENGRPFFVMELVHGVPITKYCDDNHLTPRQRLELFVPVCQAIQHAHQKGIIHRDIKPSNVMVTLYDGKPVPKVIDFGVAKATEQKLTERTLFTQYGTLVGTLEYMSPEQAEMSALGVDTRSDIYSLGVLLYELLTGSTPLTHKRIKAAAYGEILRIIKEEEPPKPSTRLSDSGEALASISANRQMEPAKLTKLVRGELDWIVMKTLEKDRNRRYATANALAADVQRHLADEPVEACPPSAGYRFRKFARRNKKVLAAAGAFAVLLMAATVISIGLASWALQERNRADEQKHVAETKENEAKERSDETKAVLDFVENQVFAAARPLEQEGGLGRDVTLRGAVESALPRVEGSFPDQPLIEARLLTTLGTSFLYLGDAKTAEKLFLRARELRTVRLGPHDAETLKSMSSLGRCLFVMGRYGEALQLQEETLRIQEAKLGPDHPDTLKTMGDLAGTYGALARIPEAVELTEKTLRLTEAKLGTDHSDTIRSMHNLGRFYTAQKRHEEARSLLEEVLRRRTIKLGATHPDTLRSAEALGVIYIAVGRHVEAARLLEDTLKSQEAILSRDHPDTLRTMHYLAKCYAALGRPAEAVKLGEETLQRRTATLGPNHLDTLVSLNSLANYCTTLGRPEEAAKWRKELDARKGHKKKK